MVAGGVDGGRQTSAEPLNADCDIFAIGADHRQVQDGDLHALGIAARRAVPVQDVDLGSQHLLVDGKLQPSACSAAILSVRRSRAADDDRHVADRPWVAGGFRQVHVAAVVGLGARRPERPERLDADLKLIRSLPVLGKSRPYA